MILNFVNKMENEKTKIKSKTKRFDLMYGNKYLSISGQTYIQEREREREWMCVCACVCVCVCVCERERERERESLLKSSLLSYHYTVWNKTKVLLHLASSPGHVASTAKINIGSQPARVCSSENRNTPIQTDMCAQQWLRPACACAQSEQRLR